MFPLKNMDEEKKNRIVNSALEEFSTNSYNKASTNNIIKKAKISKGLLFHYFKSKKALYASLKTHAMDIIIETIKEKVDIQETDFFRRIMQVVIIKMQLTDQYPHLYTFILKGYEGVSVDELYDYREKVAPGLLDQILTKNIDFSKFRDNIDLKRVLSIITWSFEKFGEELFKRLSDTKEVIDYNGIVEEFEKYIVILKEAFYK